MENTYNMFKIGINLNYAECYRRYKIEQHFKLKKQQESLLTSYCYQTFARKPRYLCKLLSSEMWTVPRVSPASPETVQTCYGSAGYRYHPVGIHFLHPNPCKIQGWIQISFKITRIRMISRRFAPKIHNIFCRIFGVAELLGFCYKYDK